MLSHAQFPTRFSAFEQLYRAKHLGRARSVEVSYYSCKNCPQKLQDQRHFGKLPHLWAFERKIRGILLVALRYPSPSARIETNGVPATIAEIGTLASNALQLASNQVARRG